MGKNTERKILPADISWKNAAPNLQDVRYEKSAEGIAKITINRPEVRNAFRPQTVNELIQCFNDAREDSSVGVIVLAGEGPDAFCSGGDQRVRGEKGYVGFDGVPRRSVFDEPEQRRQFVFSYRVGHFIQIL